MTESSELITPACLLNIKVFKSAVKRSEQYTRSKIFGVL